MRNLNATSEDSFSFFERVLKSKRNSQRDPNYKIRVAGHSGTLEPLHEAYDQNFGASSLETLQPHGFIDPAKADLKKLYSYSNKVLQELRVQVTTTSTQR